MSDIQPLKEPGPHDPNKPAAADPPPRSFGLKLVQVVIAFVVILVAGSFVSYSLRIGRGPWAWTSEDWQSYLAFSKEGVENAKQRVQQVDWANVKTKITDNTKQLWSQAPDVVHRIEDRLGIRKPGAAATPAPGAVPGQVTPAGAPDDPPELRAGLELLRAGIEHYRASPEDPNELAAAKKCFEDAEAHLEKAVSQVRDEKQRDEVQEDLRTCNKYLEDCRTREKR